MPSKSYTPPDMSNQSTANPSTTKNQSRTEVKSGAKNGRKTGGKPGTNTGKHVAKSLDICEPTPPAVERDASKRPDVRTLIGGVSWTGKLPVNLISEICQRQNWQRPEYTMTRISSGFVSSVILACENPKSGDITVLPAFAFPKSVQSEIAQPTAIEARHIAAAYALFRVSSMKNTHLMMPPRYKDLWKTLFLSLKNEDMQSGKGWMYDADPFAAALRIEDAARIEAKKRKEAEQLKAKEAQAESSSRSSLLVGQSKAWERAPAVDLGKRIRSSAELLIRQLTIWNPNGLAISDSNRQAIVRQVTSLGFRESHVHEAADICKDKQEILEWLLIHVPEDDLPSWSLPGNYVAGLSMVGSDLKKEAAIKRLATAGYSKHLCAQFLDAYAGHETKAAAALQADLLGQSISDAVDAVDTFHLHDVNNDAWSDELMVLASIFGDRCTSNSENEFRVQLEILPASSNLSLRISRATADYPASLPVLAIEGSIPAYIRLTITKQALQFASKCFLAEPMIFNIVDWIEQNGPAIIVNPGPLTSIITSPKDQDAASVSDHLQVFKRAPSKSSRTNRASLSSTQLLAAWMGRQDTPEYQKMLSMRQSLPAWSAREQVVQTISENKVTIISGETGSGKSTQAVQFLLDQMIQDSNGEAANIFCTQPRRISALGLADRVAEERCTAVGQEVGYIIRGDSKKEQGITKITFMTTGVLLRILQTAGGSEEGPAASLAHVSHVFIDEVHERAVDADLLLVILKDVLRKRQDFRLVLMSATIDATDFETYFSELGAVGIVEISGRTFPVDDYYKDHVVRMTGHNMVSDVDHAEDNDDDEQTSNKTIARALRASDMKIDYNLIAKSVDHIDSELSDDQGGILIFLPGAMEIEQTIHALRHNKKVLALPLHASLPPLEQKRVFLPAPIGRRKVIVATNIAETSITIPDIMVVIDTGRVKEMMFDPATSTRRLLQVWASKAACAQRRGRAGRVRKGICYKLFTKNMEAKMMDRPEPEILRVPLEQLCLAVKSMGIKDVFSFLAAALTPPSSQAVDSALDLLTRIGAMEDDDLTALGKHLAMIPADLRCAKLLVMGCIFGCVDACLSISALKTSKSIFFNPRDEREQVKQVRFDLAPGQGDDLSDLRAYQSWTESKRRFSGRDLRHWCGASFLNKAALHDVDSNRAQFVSALQEIGFLPVHSGPSKIPSHLNSQNLNDGLLRALITSAFYPNILSISWPATKFAASHTGALALDPEARTIKFYNAHGLRIFIHPSSTCFEPKGWPSDIKFLSYNEQSCSVLGENAKTYARGITPTNALSVLLFGGSLSLDTLGRGIMADEWIKVRGWARIGVLIARLRRLLDALLERRIDDPQSPLLDHERRILDVVQHLIENDGTDR